MKNKLIMIVVILVLIGFGKAIFGGVNGTKTVNLTDVEKERTTRSACSKAAETLAVIDYKNTFKNTYYCNYKETGGNCSNGSYNQQDYTFELTRCLANNGLGN